MHAWLTGIGWKGALVVRTCLSDGGVRRHRETRHIRKEPESGKLVSLSPARPSNVYALHSVISGPILITTQRTKSVYVR